MRRKFLIALIFSTMILSSSLVIATPKEIPPGQLKEKNAPGQWKKTIEYANQREFVNAVHQRIWERMQERNELRILAGKENLVNPIGLLKLLNLITAETELEGEEEELELEPEEEPEPEEDPEPEEEVVPEEEP